MSRNILTRWIEEAEARKIREIALFDWNLGVQKSGPRRARSRRSPVTEGFVRFREEEPVRRVPTRQYKTP
jgi:hypothetical protein